MILTICLSIIEVQSETPIADLHNMDFKSHISPIIGENNLSTYDLTKGNGVIKKNPSNSCCNICKIIYSKTQTNTAFIGAIGDDENGDIFLKCMSQYGINNRLEKIDDKKTTTYFTYSKNKNLAEIPDTGAATSLTLKYIFDNRKLIAKARIIYLCVLVIYSMPAIIKCVIEQINNQSLILNISNDWLLQYVEPMFLCDILAKCKMVIGSFKNMHRLLNALYPKKYNTVTQMLIGESKMGAIFISFDSTNDIYTAINGVYEKIAPEISKHINFSSYFTRIYFISGLLSEYHEHNKNIYACIIKGCNWAREYHNIIDISEIK